jgi:alkylated DNA repair dioxygenase AlkB
MMLNLPDAEFLYQRHFVDPEQEESFFYRLKTQIHWRSDEITLFGKKVMQPRLVAWFGPQPYRYSGLTLVPQPMPESVLELLNKLNYQLGIEFNCLLANYYRNGQDSMGWHADNDKELGADPQIASLSLGAQRVFKLRHKKDKNLKAQIQLESGSLLLMGKGSQVHYLHSLPKTAKPIGERINLTFRQIVVFDKD